MALDPRAAMLKINQERMDVQKALAAAQAEVGQKMTKKGEKGAWGKWLGQLAAPVLADWGTTALLNVFAPGLGSLYKAAKGVPVLKAGAKGLLTAYGGAKGAEMGAGSVNVGESEDLMKKYLGETVSGAKGIRFDRGATASMEAQKDLQLEALSNLMKKDAYKSGLKAVGSSLIGDLRGATAAGVKERLKGMRETQGELTAQDYLSAFTESGKDARKQLLSMDSLKDWSAKREGLTSLEALKYSDADLSEMFPKRAWTSDTGATGYLPIDEGVVGGQENLGIEPQVSAGKYARVGTPEEHFHAGKSVIEPYATESGLSMESDATEQFIKSGQADTSYGSITDPDGPAQGYAIGSPEYNEAMIQSGGKFRATSEPGLLGIPFNQESIPSGGELKLPDKPIGYEKLLEDLHNRIDKYNATGDLTNVGTNLRVQNSLGNYYGQFDNPIDMQNFLNPEDFVAYGRRK
tara:strand:- start:11120 stop:12508 length:1389 start_codon:yes stop_codon:yes gene_type:complete